MKRRPTRTLTELREDLSLIRYWPGWTIEVYETEFQGLWVVIEAQVPDAYHEGETVTLRIKSALPPQRSREQFYHWLRWRLERIAMHEVHEGLQWKDGGPIFDPHKEGADEP